MPKVTFTNIADAKWRRTGGDKIYVREGQAIIRKKTKPPPRKSPEARNTRGLMRDIALLYTSLTPAQIAEWDTYKAYTPHAWSAWNAMLTNNMRGLYPNVPCISNILDITSPAAPPGLPTGFNACYYAGLDAICVSWTDTFSFPTYVQAFEWIPPGRHRAYGCPWRYVAAALSSAQKITVPSALLIAGRIARIFIRALNLRGEVSQKTQFVPAVVPDPPVPWFVGSPRIGASPLTVHFSGLSTGLVFSRTWDFGDGEFSVEKNPSHTYTSLITKKYHVRLSLVGAVGSTAALQKTNYVTVYPAAYPFSYTVLVDNTANPAALAAYQIQLTVPAGSPIYDHAQADGGNIRFYDADGVTELSYWIESWAYGGISVFWIKVPSIPGSSTKNIYLHAIAPTVATTSSAENTFILYDGFSGDTIDATKWIERAAGLHVASGHLVFTYTGTQRGHIDSIITFPYPAICETRWYASTIVSRGSHPGVLRQSGNWNNRVDYYGSSTVNRLNFYSIKEGVQTYTENVLVSDITAYHIYKEVWELNKRRFFQDDSLKLQHTTNVPIVNMCVSFLELDTSTNPLYIDWVRVRAFAEPEPTAALT